MPEECSVVFYATWIELCVDVVFFNLDSGVRRQTIQRKTCHQEVKDSPVEDTDPSNRWGLVRQQRYKRHNSGARWEEEQVT